MRAAVVVGHPVHARGVRAAEIEVEAIERALRAYNSHLSRIAVITYETLISSA